MNVPSTKWEQSTSTTFLPGGISSMGRTPFAVMKRYNDLEMSENGVVRA